MEDNNTQKNKKELILSGICPSNHVTDETVCKGCYEELLRQYNKLKGAGDVVKSQWHTW